MVLMNLFAEQKWRCRHKEQSSIQFLMPPLDSWQEKRSARILASQGCCIK